MSRFTKTDISFFSNMTLIEIFEYVESINEIIQLENTQIKNATSKKRR